MFRSDNTYPPPQAFGTAACDTEGCGAAATGIWAATWSGERLCCDACTPWHNTAMPLPAGFTYRSLAPVPPMVPHTTGHLGVASASQMRRFAALGLTAQQANDLPAVALAAFPADADPAS